MWKSEEHSSWGPMLCFNKPPGDSEAQEVQEPLSRGKLRVFFPLLAVNFK